MLAAGKVNRKAWWSDHWGLQVKTSRSRHKNYPRQLPRPAAASTSTGAKSVKKQQLWQTTERMRRWKKLHLNSMYTNWQLSLTRQLDSSGGQLLELSHSSDFDLLAYVATDYEPGDVVWRFDLGRNRIFI